MKSTIFYFAGRAGDLPAALINHSKPIKERVDWKALNKLNLASVLYKGTDIAELANYPKKPKTPFFQSVDAPKHKCKTCGGMGAIAQRDAVGDDVEYIECPTCHPAYSTNK